MFFPKRKALTITGLGGLDRVGGANCYLLKTPQTQIMIDCGYKLSVSSEENLSLIERNCTRDYPNLSAIGKMKGIVLLTHAHMDHIGAIPKLVERQPQQEIEVLAGTLTLKIVRKILFTDIPWNQNLPFRQTRIFPNQVISYEGATIIPIEVLHSIPQNLGFYLEMGGKKIFYSGDFKLRSPYSYQENAMKRSLAEIGKKQIDILFLESSGVERKGFTSSEEVVWGELKRLFYLTPGRIILTTFSSHLDRLRAIIRIAGFQNRPVYVAGRNLSVYLRALNVQGWNWLKRNMIPEPNALIITTGCQAEAGSGLVRAVFGEAPFQLSCHDTIIMAARPIPEPGIEDGVRKLVSRLASIVSRVYISDEAPADFPREARRVKIHVSGHGGREDLRYVIQTTNPKLVIPIHGDPERREALATLVKKMGMRAKVISQMESLEV